MYIPMYPVLHGPLAGTSIPSMLTGVAHSVPPPAPLLLDVALVLLVALVALFDVYASVLELASPPPLLDEGSCVITDPQPESAAICMEPRPRAPRMSRSIAM